MNTIADNLKIIQDNIALSCAKAGRKPEDVSLVAVTKYVPAERVQIALELGIRHVGENRVQEFTQKKELFDNYDCITSFIGQLQTNKVKYVVGEADLIQSVDRLALVNEIQRQAGKLGVTQDVLVEINIGEEPQKGGVLPGELLPLLCELEDKPLRVKGLMCLPPALEREAVRPYFARMRELFESLKSQYPFEHLSMGMSGDYTTAIEEGATMIRLGSALFGPRQYV